MDNKESGIVLMSQSLYRNSIRLIARKEPAANEGKVYKVWLIMECEYITEDPKDGLYLPKVWKVRQQEVGQFIKKAAIFMARLSGTATLTYLYSVKAIESAFLDRGYVAYGGEYLMIPFVFYAVFKVLGGIGVLCSGIFRKKRKEMIKR